MKGTIIKTSKQITVSYLEYVTELAQDMTMFLPIHPDNDSTLLKDRQDVDFSIEEEVKGRNSYLEGYPALKKYAKLIQ